MTLMIKRYFSLFEFDNLFDIVYEMEGHKMKRDGLSEDSIHLLSAPENEKSKKITKGTKRST